ncbi:MAG: hypothetical protein ACLR8Y_02400 [Alistipes indistinctus]
MTDHDGSKAIRGSNAWSWPVDTLLSEGFGLVTACYNDIYPDGTVTGIECDPPVRRHVAAGRRLGR